MTSIGGANRRIIAGVGASGGGKRSAGAVASGAMSAIAGKMASSVTGFLRLAGEDGEADLASPSDPYDIEELMEQLSRGLDGGPADRGALSHSLHEFVQEGAALFVARPEARALSHIDNAINAVTDSDSSDGDADMKNVAALIDSATRNIMERVA